MWRRGSHSHHQYLQYFVSIILFYTVNLYRNIVFAMPTHLLYFKPYSLTQYLWPGTSWIWILIKEPHSTLQDSPPGSGCGGCLTVPEQPIVRRKTAVSHPLRSSSSCYTSSPCNKIPAEDSIVSMEPDLLTWASIFCLYVWTDYGGSIHSGEIP